MSNTKPLDFWLDLHNKDQHGWMDAIYVEGDKDIYPNWIRVIEYSSYQAALGEIEALKKTAKCCLGAHIPGYGHSRNCRGGFSNLADDVSGLIKDNQALKAKVAKFTEIIELLINDNRTENCRIARQALGEK